MASPKKIKHELKKTVSLIQQKLPAKVLKELPPIPIPVERPRFEEETSSMKKGALKALSKQIRRKKARIKSLPSKRTTPGELLTRDAAPAYPKKEGKRWINETQKKIAANRKIATHRTLKRSGR